MSSIIFEVKNSIAFITLNRPEKLNSFTTEMILDLQEKLDACQSDEVRCVYITGAGKGFSAGQDLSEVIGEKNTSFEKILSDYYNPLITKIRSLEKPVVAAVNGVAAGAGANVALSCDIVIAATSAYFIQSFSKIGLVPDSGGTYFLPRLIGWQKATAAMMLGEKISAADAERSGMIYKCFPDEAFYENALNIAQSLAQLPTKGLAYTKQLLNQSLTNTLQQQLQLEDVFQQKAVQTYDYNEGVNAFLEKRKANFKGI